MLFLQTKKMISGELFFAIPVQWYKDMAETDDKGVLEASTQKV
jgi:hypothetical protein